jgi:hypothetical protein
MRSRSVCCALLLLAFSTASLAAPPDPKATRKSLESLDFAQLEIPEGFELQQASTATAVFTASHKVKPAFEAIAGSLSKKGWEDQQAFAGRQIMEEFASAQFKNGEFTLSVAVSSIAGQTQVVLNNHGNLDTRKVPRPQGAKPDFEERFTSIYTVPGSVQQAVQSCRQKLAAEGWQEYMAPGTTNPEDPERAVLEFRYGPLNLNVYITIAPAQGGKTSLQYTAQLLADELPWPADVARAEFSPTALELAATTEKPVDELVKFYGAELKGLGWTADAGWMIVDDDSADLIFRDDREKLIRLKLSSSNEGTRIEVESISLADFRELSGANELPTITRARPGQPAQPTEPSPPVASESHASARALPLPPNARKVEYDADASEITFTSESSTTELARFFRDKLVGHGWEEEALASVITAQVASLNLTGKDEADLSITMINLGLGGGTEVTISVDGLSFAEAEPGNVPDRPSGSPPPPSEEVTAEDRDGLPVPSNNTEFSRERTPFRTTLTTATPSSLADMVAFYRKHLAAAGWEEAADEAKVEDESARLVFSGKDGKMVATFTRADDATRVELAIKSSAAAEAAGVLPKPGKVRVIFGNTTEQTVKVTFGGRPFDIGPGVGAMKPDGPGFDVAPGKYTIKIEIKGGETFTEKVTMGADETWGMIIGEGGLLPILTY